MYAHINCFRSVPVSMYVCMYTCIYACNVCVCVCMYVCMYTCIYVCNVCVCMYVVCMYEVHMCVCVCVCTCVHVYVYKWVHLPELASCVSPNADTYVCVCVYVCVWAFVRACVCVCDVWCFPPIIRALCKPICMNARYSHIQAHPFLIGHTMHMHVFQQCRSLSSRRLRLLNLCWMSHRVSMLCADLMAHAFDESHSKRWYARMNFVLVAFGYSQKALHGFVMVSNVCMQARMGYWK